MGFYQYGSLNYMLNNLFGLIFYYMGPYFNYFKGLSLKAAGQEERAIKTFQDLAKINFSAWEIAIVKRLAQKQLSGV